MKKIILLAWMLPILAIANEQGNIDQWKSEEYKLFVRDKLVKNMQDMFFKNGECAKLAMETNISEKVIQKINQLKLTESEITSALTYFSYKAHLHCMGDLPLMTVGYLNEARALGVDNFSLEDDPKFDHLNNLLIDTKVLTRAEYQYSKISKDKQYVLNNLEELKNPFNISVILKLKLNH